MDVFERLNRKFGSWYEALFGAGADPGDELRPKDVLRRIVAALEDARREGLDGQVYVPNQVTLRIRVRGDEERDYLRAFLDADELEAAVRRSLAQHQYKTRGGLEFRIEEVVPEEPDIPRLSIVCRFDTSVPEKPKQKPSSAAVAGAAAAEDADMETIAATVPAQRRGAGRTNTGATVGRLLVVNSPDSTLSNAEFAIHAAGARIGRSRQAGNEIVLRQDAGISKQHAEIIVGPDNSVSLYDTGSTNGTLVNQAAVGPEGARLSAGDLIQIGQTTLRFVAETGFEVAHAAATSRVVAEPVFSARLVAGDGSTFPLASRMEAGRALTSDIHLIGDGVAARHAIFTVHDRQIQVEDLGTDAGTFVNGERIPPRFPVVVYAGDDIRLGAVQLRVEVR